MDAVQDIAGQPHQLREHARSKLKLYCTSELALADLCHCQLAQDALQITVVLLAPDKPLASGSKATILTIPLHTEAPDDGKVEGGSCLSNAQLRLNSNNVATTPSRPCSVVGATNSALLTRLPSVCARGDRTNTWWFCRSGLTRCACQLARHGACIPGPCQASTRRTNASFASRKFLSMLLAMVNSTVCARTIHSAQAWLRCCASSCNGAHAAHGTVPSRDMTAKTPLCILIRA